MAITKNPITVKRKFHFFNVIGENFENIMHEINIVKNLEDIYMENGEGRTIYLGNWEKKNDYYFGFFVSAKWQDHPEKVTRGNKNLLDLGLSDKDGIGEKTYYIYIPTKKILVVEYNHYGTRAGNISEYLNYISHHGIVNKIYERFDIHIVMNKDVQIKLEQLQHLTSLDIKIRKDNINETSSIDSNIKEALESASKIGNSQYITLKVKSRKGDGRLLEGDNGLLKRIKNYFSKNTGSETFETFKISGLEKEDHKLAIFDLLKDKIEYVDDIIKLNSSRKLDSEDIFKKLKKAYTTKKDLLDKL